jgi:RNA polymerase-binding transcription factor DksA
VTVNQDTARESLEQLLRELDAATQVLEGEEHDGEGEQVDSPHDAVDSSSQLSELGREDAVMEAAAERRVEVTEALARLDAGTYGTCVDCGEPIDGARLDYRPEAARCLADQEKLEADL